MCGLLGGFRAAREGVCLCRFVTDQDGVAEAPELECLRCHSCCHADAPRGLPRNQSPHLLFPRRSRDFTESPRIMGPLQSSVSFPHEVSTALPVFLQCPWIPGLYSGSHFSTALPMFLQCPRILGLYSGSHFSTALPMVLQCPRIQGLYTALHFPGRFPVRLQSPRIPGLYSGSNFSMALPMDLRSLWIRGLCAPEVVGCLDL